MCVCVCVCVVCVRVCARVVCIPRWGGGRGFPGPAPLPGSAPGEGFSEGQISRCFLQFELRSAVVCISFKVLLSFVSGPGDCVVPVESGQKQIVVCGVMFGESPCQAL